MSGRSLSPTILPEDEQEAQRQEQEAEEEKMVAVGFPEHKHKSSSRVNKVEPPAAKECKGKVGPEDLSPPNPTSLKSEECKSKKKRHTVPEFTVRAS
jgi:hypothetical protein